MQINSFKLLDDGFTGIQVTARESIAQGNLTIIDEVTRTRKYPLPEDLKRAVQKLKYFFLNLTGHWIEPYNKCFDLEKYDFIKINEGVVPPKSFMLLQNLMNHTHITGISLKNSGFCITGAIETVEGKKMGLSTPFVIEEDDVSFFIEASDKINHILDEIAGVLKSTKAVEFDAHEVIIRKGLNPENLEGMSKEEMVDLVVHKLNDMGVVVLVNDGPASLEEKTGEKKTKIHTGTKSIDSHNMSDAIEHNDSTEGTDEQIIIKDKAPIGKGSLASEKKFPRVGDDGKVIPGNNAENIPEGGSLEHLEYSENLGMAAGGAGIEDDMPPVETKTEW